MNGQQAWESWQAFLHMGGHGLYVWGSFGVLAWGLAWEAWHLAQMASRVRQHVAERWLHAEGAEITDGTEHRT